MPETSEATETRETTEAPAGRPRRFSVLIENPAYRWFFAGQGASLVGTWSQAAAVRWIVYAQTHSERTVGVVDAIETLPGVVVGLVAGVVADRVAPRPLMIGMLVGQMAIAATLAAIVGGGGVRIWEMAALLAVASVFVTFEEPARQVFQRRLVGRSSLGVAIALEAGLFNVARVVGPALAGACLALVGWWAPFALNGLSFLAALGVLAAIRTPKTPDDPAPDPGEAVDFLAGLRHVWGDRRIARTFVALGFFGVVGMGYTALLPAYATRTLHGAEGGYSALQVSGGVGSLVGAGVVAAVAGRRRRDLLVPGGMLLAGISLAGAGLLPGIVGDRLGLVAASACMFADGLGTIAVFATAQTLIQAAVPDALRGRVIGLWMILYSASFPVGALIAGSLAKPVGVAPIFVGSAAACGLAAAYLFASGALAPRPGEEG